MEFFKPSIIRSDGQEKRLPYAIANPFQCELLKYKWAKATGADRLYSRAFTGLHRDGSATIHWLEAFPAKGQPGCYQITYCTYDGSGFEPWSYSLEKRSLQSTNWSDHWSDAAAERLKSRVFTRDEVLQAVKTFEADFTTDNPALGCPTPRNGPQRVYGQASEPFKDLQAVRTEPTPAI